MVFALKRRDEWTGQLLRIHWGVDDPYNTYRYPGLPPGPINSPGRAALRAAISPEEHRYLYFVASPDGGHHFSQTLAASTTRPWQGGSGLVVHRHPTPV